MPLQAPSSAPSATELDLLEDFTNVVPDTVNLTVRDHSRIHGALPLPHSC